MVNLAKKSIKKDQKLGPDRRVKKRREFLFIQGKGRKLHAEHILISVIQTGKPEDTKQSRLGITVTKKVDKLAVKRNLFKRRVRDIFRKTRERFIVPFDIAVIAKTGATELSFEELKKELDFLFKKGGLIEARKRS